MASWFDLRSPMIRRTIETLPGTRVLIFARHARKILPIQPILPRTPRRWKRTMSQQKAARRDRSFRVEVLEDRTLLNAAMPAPAGVAEIHTLKQKFHNVTLTATISGTYSATPLSATSFQ